MTDCPLCDLTDEAQAHPFGFARDLDDPYPSVHFQHYIERHGLPANRDQMFEMWCYALAHVITMQFAARGPR